MNSKKLYLIEWIDAKSDCKWIEESEIDEWNKDECIVTDIGWILNETDKYLTISSQFANDGSWGNRTKIPKTWIKKRRVVCEKKTKTNSCTKSKAQPRKSTG